LTDFLKSMMEHKLSGQRVVIVIPARFCSTRLPGKPLVDILGKPMVQHVYERAMQVPSASVVVVATDDDRVARAVAAFGGSYVMTSPDHFSGTDRLVEVMAQLEADVYINLQGDEPLIRSADVTKLADSMLENPSVQVGTLCHPIDNGEAVNPNTVKVVLASNGDALYFSRSPIPYPRDADVDVVRYLKHVGVYAYRREVLASYTNLPQPMMEHAEKLEQLRLLAAGIRIRAYEVEPTGPGVDTPECLKHVRALMSGQD
jgi:3-deoxy-D-manno-octulosonate 8-phosphate phosphatase (KDO 8-P phosphatase)